MSHIIDLASGTIGPGAFTAVTIGYAVGGLISLAIGITGFGGKSTGRRVLAGIIGVVCLGYAGYLQFGQADEVIISYYIMLLPLIVLIQAIVAAVRHTGNSGAGTAPQFGAAGGPPAGYPQQQGYPGPGQPQQGYPGGQQPQGYPGGQQQQAPPQQGQMTSNGQQPMWPSTPQPGPGGPQPARPAGYGAPNAPGGQPGMGGQPVPPSAGATPAQPSTQPPPTPPAQTGQPLWPTQDPTAPESR